MKRIINACLEQTNRFECEAEFQAYTAALDRKGVKYKIDGKTAGDDGSVIVKVKKQYNNYDVGDYLS